MSTRGLSFLFTRYTFCIGYKPNPRLLFKARQRKTMQNSIITPWTPRSGWNSIFSAEERQKGSDVFHHLMNTCKAHTTQRVLQLTDATAETIVMMKMYQEKYPGLRYSDAQESILHQYVSPVSPVTRVKHEHKVSRIAPVPPRISQQPLAQPQHHTRTPYAALLSIDREQHQGEHGHKKENRLNEHPRHRESTVGQKRDGRTKEALKHPRSLGVRK